MNGTGAPGGLYVTLGATGPVVSDLDEGVCLMPRMSRSLIVGYSNVGELVFREEDSGLVGELISLTAEDEFIGSPVVGSNHIGGPGLTIGDLSPSTPL